MATGEEDEELGGVVEADDALAALAVRVLSREDLLEAALPVEGVDDRVGDFRREPFDVEDVEDEEGGGDEEESEVDGEPARDDAGRGGGAPFRGGRRVEGRGPHAEDLGRHGGGFVKRRFAS